MSTQDKLGNSLLLSLIELRKSKGRILIEDVEAILKNMAASLQSEESPPVAVLKTEILKIAEHIADAKKEIVSLRPEEEKPENEGKQEAQVKNISSAFAQLKAVVKATEEATTTILDAADEIEAAVSKMGRGTEEEARIKASSARIYEACNFQDLTGQRITKVVNMLEFIDDKINRILSMFADDPVAAAKAAKGIKQDNRANVELLNGPALPGSGPSQSEIDALFNSLK